MFSKLFRATLPVLGLMAMFAVPVTLTAADDAAKPAATTPYALETCIVCDKPLKDTTPVVVAIEGRQMECCSDKCASEVKAHSEYYKGVYDGAARAKGLYIGPKGGDSRKGLYSNP